MRQALLFAIIPIVIFASEPPARATTDADSNHTVTMIEANSFQPVPLPDNKQFHNLIGQQFNRLTVLSYAGRRDRKAFWMCRCECGSEKIIEAHELKSGGTKSCGCFRKEVTGGIRRTHGLTGFRPFKIWSQIASRCENPTVKSFKYYGGRGISVCEEWRTFDGFWKDMENGYADGLTLERINNNGNYEPGNCRWATRKEQSNNTRSNRFWTFNGRTQTMNQWAEEIGIHPVTLYYRVTKSGWPISKALSTPLKRRNT